MRVITILQTCPQRQTSRAETIQSVEKSDIKDYVLMEHPVQAGTIPSHEQVRHFFLEVLQTAMASGAEYLLRLEDDIIVNEHIMHNICTWPALMESDFGAGGVFVPHGVAMDWNRVGRGRRTGCRYRDDKDMHAALAVLLPMYMVTLAYRRIQNEEWREEGGKYGAQDLSLSRTVWAEHARCYLHAPSLVEARPEVPSERGHETSADSPDHRALDGFSPTWRRA